MPPSRLTTLQITSFVTSYIRAQKAPAHEPIEGKTLIQACQCVLCDEFTQTGEEYAEDRRAIVEAIKGLKMRGMLKAFRLGGGGVGFGLAEGNVRGEGERVKDNVVEEVVEEEEVEERPTIILGDVATSDAAEGEEGGDEERDEDGDFSPPVEQEEDDTPRAVRAEDREHNARVDDADEEEEEEAPIERTSWSEVPSLGLDRSSQEESINHAEAIRTLPLPHIHQPS
ncbi:hypothetical protein BKA65DRAFT_149302 [Rhexocercosporidium sp. MPI-PUGE-AT-0058]|nr:hypothetical protein BKA65DRAFT_149302 [Rhexocercosporidium sp. MPI-PUGE-AT-0058]